jgi:hypothetical protein
MVRSGLDRADCHHDLRHRRNRPRSQPICGAVVTSPVTVGWHWARTRPSGSTNRRRVDTRVDLIVDWRDRGFP